MTAIESVKKIYQKSNSEGNTKSNLRNTKKRETALFSIISIVFFGSALLRL